MDSKMHEKMQAMTNKVGEALRKVENTEHILVSLQAKAVTDRKTKWVQFRVSGSDELLSVGWDRFEAMLRDQLAEHKSELRQLESFFCEKMLDKEDEEK